MIRKHFPEAGLGLLIALLYSVPLLAPLVYDDITLIQHNPLVMGPWPGWRAFLGYTYSEMIEYEPLVAFIHWVLARLHRGVELFRLSNLFLHWLNAVLILRVFRRLLGEEKPALVAAILFALFPAHTEILAIATFKKHLLVSACALGVVELQAAAGPWTARLAAACVLQALALLSKESALLIPIFVGLVGLAGPAESARRDPSRRLIFPAALAMVAGVYVLFRLFLLPRLYPSPLTGDWILHGITSAKCLFWSLSQMLWPWDLCLEHTVLPVASWTEPEAWLLLAGLAVLGETLRRLWRSDRVAALGLSWSVLFLLPFINLVPFLNFSLVSNRYLYMSSAGFFLLVLRAFQRFAAARPGQSAALTLAAAPVVIAYGLMDLVIMSRFADPLSLWGDTALCAPANPRARTGLALALLEHKLFGRAEFEFKKALDLNPGFSVPRLGLASLYARTDRLDEAVAIVEDELKRKPSAFVYTSLGIYLLQAERAEAALAAYRKALEFEPGAPQHLIGCGLSHLSLKQFDEAEDALLTAALSEDFKPTSFKFLGEIYAKRGKLDTAVLLYERSLALSPHQPDAAVNLAKLYRRRNQPGKAREVLRSLLARLERSMAEADSRSRPEDQEILSQAREQYLSARSALEELH